MSETKSEKSGGRVWPGGHVLRLDLRSLAVARVVYGTLLFLDTLVRWSDVIPFYSEFGTLPRRYLLEYGGHEHWFSLHMASGSLVWTNFLFLVQACAALAMLVGWHTRVATCTLWLLLISLHARNPMVLNGGDIYLRMILLWMMFLPTGHRWSVDARRGRGDHYPWMPTLTRNSLFSVAALAVLIQISSVYWFASIPKSDPTWTVNFHATNLALHLDQFLTPVGLYFRDSLGVEYLATLTSWVIWWEFWGPFFLFFPFDRGQVRIFGICGFMALHAGFGTMMRLGFFAWTGALTPLILLPSWFWDSPFKRVSRWLDRQLGEGPPAQEDPRYTWPREIFFFLIILYCFGWNMDNERLSPSRFRLSPRLYWIGHAFRLDQRWNMFSPGPLTEDGWYVIEGRFRDGRVLDLFKEGAELSWDKPRDVANTYKNQRWRKYMMNLWLVENADYRLPFGQYICRKWNTGRSVDEELVGFDIYYMLEVTNLDGTEQLPEKKSIWNHWCFDAPDDKKSTTESRVQKEALKNIVENSKVRDFKAR